MLRAATQFKKTIIFVHRWMGVFFCLLFPLWFTSGMVLMYFDYPMVSAATRLSRAPALDATRIRLSPQQAYARLQTGLPPGEVTTETRLDTFDARPAYRFGAGDDVSIVYADDGQVQTDFPREMTLRIAAAWTGQPTSTAKVEENTEEDQWTVSGEFRALRPMRKYTWPDGEQVYVSTVTGDVVQYTTRASRMGAYFGAIPHWLYFTPVRRHAQQWSRLVIWVSGLGTMAAILGIVVGLWTYSPSKPFRHAGTPSSLPYTGQKRWHAILGLTFGLLACTWTFSGMLSMDPLPRLQGETSEGAADHLEHALRGDPPLLRVFDAKLPQEALAQVGADFQVKELEFASFAGEPTYLASAGPNQTRVVPGHGEPSEEFDRDKIIEVIRKAAQPATLSEVRLVTEYEAYYLDRHNRLPLPVIFVRLNDNGHSSYYVDPKTARIVQSYNSNSRWNRWLYHGLHSMDLPWLYKHRPAWDIVVLVFMLGGTSLCVTALLLAWRVVRAKLAPRLEVRD